MAEKPKIELRNIRHIERMSEETNCYSATLYVDGEKWGEVSNRGVGGCDDIHLAAGKSYADLEALEARIRGSFGQMHFEGDEFGAAIQIDYSLELVCANILSEWLQAKELKRLLSRKVVFFRERPAPDRAAPLYEIPLKGHPAEAYLPLLAKRHPGAVILNILPPAEALALFAQAS